MSSGTTIILPLDLGAAAKYDQSVFPLAYHGSSSGNVTKGSLLLSATLEEIVKIKELGTDLSSNDEFFFNARLRYEGLVAKRKKLQDNKKTLNPYKAFQNYRAARMFHAASLTLYLDTKETSEQIQREHSLLKMVPSAEVHAFDNAVPADATIGGIAINLPGAPDDDAIRKISDATATIASYVSDSRVDDSRISRLTEEGATISLDDTQSMFTESLLSLLEASDVDIHEDVQMLATSSGGRRTDTTSPSPSSPQPIIQIYNRSIIAADSIIAANSRVVAPTVNHGSRNSGASISR